MKNLYALLVGINKYQPPNTPLYGCVKDVERVADYLRTYHEGEYNLQILKLVDEDATYANVIKAFREHLSRAKGDDVVWFHFSGHGSEENTAVEFLSIEPNGKDQTLWCYDSGIGAVDNLADKELAVLLHHVSNRDEDDNAKASGPQILVSLDCCHSGSGTRDAGEPETVRTRNARSSGRNRSLESYVHGHYCDQGSTLQVPSCPHVLLSACQTYQRAGDLNDGGAFTSGLIRALKSSKGQINYADLFIRTRASVRQIRDNQMPDFTSIENFNPYTRFLGAETIGHPDYFEVFVENGKWYIKCGAIHSLPTEWKTPIDVEIRSFPKNVVLGTATISSVGAQRSLLDVSSMFSIKSTWNEILPGEDYYRGVIMQFPAPTVYVYLHGHDEAIKQLRELWPSTVIIQPALELTPDCTIECEVYPDRICLTDLRTCTMVQEQKIEAETPWSKVMEEVFTSFEKIVKWYRLRELNNKSKSSVIRDWVELNLYVYNTKGEIKNYTDNHVQLFANESNSRNFEFGFLPKVNIKHTEQDLYFYLMYMQPNFAIDCPDGEVVFRSSEYENIAQLELALWKEIKGFGPKKDEPSVTSVFKLLVTTEKLDYFQFLQSRLGNFRSSLSTWAPDKISDDWAVIDMSVTISKSKPIHSNEESVHITESVSVTSLENSSAEISLTPTTSLQRKTHAEDDATCLQQPGFELVDLRPNQEVSGIHSLEIQNVKLDPATSDNSTGIRINIDQTFGQDELVFPMTFDGRYFRVAGLNEIEDEGSSVLITSLPTLSIAGEQTSQYEGERSVFSAMKLTFFKLVLNKEKINRLSILDVVDDELVLSQSGLAERFMTSKRFLLVLHGMIGDGLSLCKDLATNNLDVLQHYDCVLVYDYESMHTPIDETAGLLQEELSNLNISGHQDKQLDVVAHCCGGLVARWLIEQNDGKEYINRLTMLGTPNGGTLFGKVEEYRSFALNILELAANFLPHILPGSGLLIKLLKMAGNLTPALGQMSPDSDFLTKLNTSRDPEIPYVITAGDASQIESSQATQLIRRLYGDVTRSGHNADAHDLFTSVKSAEYKSILELRLIKPEYANPVSNHHFSLGLNAVLNYKI